MSAPTGTPSGPPSAGVRTETPKAARRGAGGDPLFVIRPGIVPARRYVRDLFDHRDLIGILATRDLKLRYRQTALGASWVVLQPLLAAGILSIVFGKIAKLPTDGIPSFVFTYAGTLVWTTLSGTITRSTNSLLTNASLVAKVYFPRLILPLSTLVAGAVDFAVGMVVMVILMFSSGLPPGFPFLLVPVWVIVGMMLTVGVGLVLATMSVHYRDVPHVTPVLLQLLLYASPVAYAISAVPDRWVNIYYLNPLSGLIGAFRWSLLQTPFPPAWALTYSAALAVLSFVGGMYTLGRFEQRFADVI